MLVISFHAHEHIHSASTSGTGHLVKHWHFDDDHSESVGNVFDQEHHGPDGAVQVHFKTSKIFVFPPPALLTAMLDAPPAEPRIEYIPSAILPITHGPPRQPLPSRAPPQSTLL